MMIIILIIFSSMPRKEDGIIDTVIQRKVIHRTNQKRKTLQFHPITCLDSYHLPTTVYRWRETQRKLPKMVNWHLYFLQSIYSSESER